MQFTAADAVSTIRVLTAQCIWCPTQSPHSHVAECCFMVSVLADALDGYVARRVGPPSNHGAFVDVACDRLTEQSAWLSLLDHRTLRHSHVPHILLWRLAIVDMARFVGNVRGEVVWSAPRPIDTLVRSPTSKVCYNALKVGTVIAIRHHWSGANLASAALTIYSLIRAYPAVRSATLPRGIASDLGDGSDRSSTLRIAFLLQCLTSLAAAAIGSAQALATKGRGEL